MCLKFRDFYARYCIIIRRTVVMGFAIVLLVIAISSGLLRQCDSPWEDTTYIICDVVNTSWELGITGTEYSTLSVVMPNGEIHDYKISDPPEGKINEICFKATNQDDYATYKVVAVR